MTVKKPLLKLTDEDYNEHGLQELLSHRGSAHTTSTSKSSRRMQNTITGWPGGKPASRCDMRQRRPLNPLDQPPRETLGPARTKTAPDKSIYPKRVVVFSPHPDDDVISMGGTFIRLCEQGHDVHVAYQTSGNIAVLDDAAVRHADFVAEYSRAFQARPGAGRRRSNSSIEVSSGNKKPGEVDSPELQQIKGLIRRTEARAGARYSGVKPENIHFLDMPFYETGRVRKKPLERAGHPDHRGSAGEGSAAPGICRRRSCPTRTARIASAWRRSSRRCDRLQGPRLDAPTARSGSIAAPGRNGACTKSKWPSRSAPTK